MDIYQRLKEDHEKQRTLGEVLSKTSGDSDGRNELYAKYKAELITHANAEEQSLYAALIEKADGQEKAQHSVAEHKEMMDLLEELDNTDMSSSAWIQKFDKLNHKVVHHVDEEEEDVFPVAKKLFSDQMAKDLADKFDERKKMEAEEHAA